MEQLEENTRQEHVKQVFKEVALYVDECLEKLRVAHYWSERAHLLEIVTLAAHMIVIGITIWRIPEQDVYATLSFILWFGTSTRQWILLGDAKRAVGEYKGAITVLEKLGYLEINDRSNGKGIKKKIERKSLFPRFKEFWERITSPDKKEQYA